LSPGAAGLVPDFAPYFVEGGAGERDDVERVEAERRLRAALLDDAGDPLAEVAGDELEPRAPLRTERVEEALDGLLVAAVGGPDEPARVVVDDNSDVALALAVGELVDPDPPQPGERVAAPARLLCDHPLDDPADGQPGDPDQLTDRALRAVRRQPSDLLLELARKPGAMPRPAHTCDNNPVLPALDPRRRRLDERPCRAQVERPPAPPAHAPVIARRPPTADTAASDIASPRPRANHQPHLVDLHALYHHPPEPEQPSEYAPSAHAVTCLLREPTWKPENLRSEAACAYQTTHGTVRTALFRLSFPAP